MADEKNTRLGRVIAITAGITTILVGVLAGALHWLQIQKIRSETIEKMRVEMVQTRYSVSPFQDLPASMQKKLQDASASVSLNISNLTSETLHKTVVQLPEQYEGIAQIYSVGKPVKWNEFEKGRIEAGDIDAANYKRVELWLNSGLPSGDALLVTTQEGGVRQGVVAMPLLDHELPLLYTLQAAFVALCAASVILLVGCIALSVIAVHYWRKSRSLATPNSPESSNEELELESKNSSDS